MFHPTEDFHKYIHPGKRVHLAGIGGVSMCALAEVLQGMGVTVQGSDMSESDTVTKNILLLLSPKFCERA